MLHSSCPGQAALACSICGKAYQRSSHLRRHELTHTESDGFHCPFCDKPFRRRDVCRKHSLHCHSKGTRDDPPFVKRGQKARACDACCRSRLACDNVLPACSRCRSRRLGCSYTRLARGALGTSSRSVNSSEDVAGGHDGGLTIPPPGRASQSHTEGVDGLDGRDEKMAASFLLSLTNPKAETMIQAFMSEPARFELETAKGTSAPELRADGAEPADFDGVGDGMMTNSSFFEWILGASGMDVLDFGTGPTQLRERGRLDGLDLLVNRCPVSSCLRPDALDNKLRAVISGLEAAHERLRIIDPSYDGSFHRGVAEDIFSAQNVRLFITSFFGLTHLDFPITHRSTFRAEEAAPELLLSMLLSGSLGVPPTDEALSARGFCRLAEELAFWRLAEAMASVAATMPGHQEGGGDEKEARLLQTLQAAVIIHSQQSFTSCASTRRRTRAQRLPLLVDAVRALGLTKSRHQLRAEGIEDRWREFVRTETKIRIAHWTFLADCHQSGLFNCPATMTTLEMDGDVPCLHELWEAPDAHEFDAEVGARGGPESCLLRACSLRACVDTLMREGWDGPGKFPLRHLSLQDLFLLVFLMPGAILNARFTDILQASAPVILRAISRWQELWDHAVRGFSAEGLSRMGLVRHSVELCLLAKRMLEVLLSGRADESAYFRGVAHSSLAELHDFLRQHCCEQNRERGGLQRGGAIC